MNHTELNKYIKHYFQEDKTHSAIMLTAPWGTGKSYYIQNDLIPFLSKEENGNIKCVVVSLYGMNALFDLSRALYMESRFKKLVNSSEVATTGKFAAKTVLKGVTSFFNIDLSKTEEEMKELYESVDFSGKLIILEDLERTDIGIFKLLGYVNNLVEQDGVKVLLVANEEEMIEYEPIPAKNANEEKKNKFYDTILDHKGRVYTEPTKEYIKTKEKTVSDTILFESSFPKAVVEIIKNYHNTYLDTFAQGTELSELNIYCDSLGITNLRTFVFACQKTVDIYQTIKLDRKNDSDFIKTIFYSIIALSQTIKSEEKPNWSGGELFSIELSTEEYPLFRFCYDYVINHTLELSRVDEAKAALNKLRLYDKHKSLGDPDLSVLYSWWLHSEKEVLTTIDSITSRLKNEKDISFYEYGRIAVYLIRAKEVIDCNIDKAKELLINNLHNKGNEIDADYIFTAIIDTRVKSEAIEEYKKLKDDMTKSLAAKKATLFDFDYQPSSVVDFSNKVKDKKGIIIGNGAFASKLDNDRIISMLKQCEPVEIQEFRLAYYRIYESINISDFLSEDKEALKDLLNKVKVLKNYSEYDRIQKYLITLLADTLEEALTRYN